MLNKDNLREKFPSMFTTHAKEGVSERYSFVGTEPVIDEFLNNGFYIERANSVKVRKPENAPHCKHFVGFRSGTDFGLVDPRDTSKAMIPEILLTNSSDAKSAIVLSLGLYTFVCSNGLVIGSTHDMLRIPHTNVDYEKLKQYIIFFQSSVGSMAKSVGKLSNTYLSEDARQEFAYQAALLRWGSTDKVDPMSLLNPRREADSWNKSAWTTYNVVQENLIRGGVPTRNGRDRLTRAVRSSVKDFDLNVKLWSLVLKMST